MISTALKKVKPTQLILNYNINALKIIGLTAACTIKRNFHKKQDYAACFTILQIPKDSDQETVRQAFLKLVKRYHPDSGSPEANVEQFNRIETAYRKLQNKFSDERWNANKCAGEYGLYYEEKQEKLVKQFDIKHTAPQHRQYLSYDGYGSGTPTQRQKQYEKKRAATAIENVHNHRVTKLKYTHEEGLVIKDKVEAKKIKTRFEVDRLVEDLIQESMARGEFDNLAGSGKPLPANHHSNPYVDFVTHKMNQVLIDNGFTPEWITLQKEIREEVQDLRARLLNERTQFGPLPLTLSEQHEWDVCVKDKEEMVQRINKKINQFNLVVPLLVKQLIFINLEKVATTILEEGKTNLEVQYRVESNQKESDKTCTESGGGTKNLFGLLESLFSR